jgi:hypothetical protein
MLSCFFLYLSHYAFYIILLLQTSDVAHATRLWPIPMPHSLPLELAAAVAGDSLVAMEIPTGLHHRSAPIGVYLEFTRANPLNALVRHRARFLSSLFCLSIRVTALLT